MEDDRCRRRLAQMARDSPPHIVHAIQSGQGPRQRRPDKAQPPDGRDHKRWRTLRGGRRLELAEEQSQKTGLTVDRIHHFRRRPRRSPRPASRPHADELDASKLPLGRRWRAGSMTHLYVLFCTLSFLCLIRTCPRMFYFPLFCVLPQLPTE